MPKIHLRQDVYDKLVELAEHQDRSISNMAERIIYNVWRKQPKDKSLGLSSEVTREHDEWSPEMWMRAAAARGLTPERAIERLMNMAQNE